MENNICCVVVTFNRLDKLKKALMSYSQQSLKPKELIVIDNFSTDGTINFLKKWELINEAYLKKVVYLNHNFGGAGGFYYGINEFLKSNAKYAFLADDDAYLENDVLEKISNGISSSNESVGAFCTSVIDKDGIDFTHRRYLKKSVFKLKESSSIQSDYEKNKFDITIFSFVGVCINKEVIEKIGLPKKDFFIWYDDTEYSFRFFNKYKIICLPNAKVFHDKKAENSGINWKMFYGYRNRLLAIKYNFGRWYFFINCVYLSKSILSNFLKNKKMARIQKAALIYALKNKEGINSLYLPNVKF